MHRIFLHFLDKLKFFYFISFIFFWFNFSLLKISPRCCEHQQFIPVFTSWLDFDGLLPFRPIGPLFGCGMQDSGSDSGPGRNGRRPGENISARRVSQRPDTRTPGTSGLRTPLILPPADWRGSGAHGNPGTVLAGWRRAGKSEHCLSRGINVSQTRWIVGNLLTGHRMSWTGRNIVLEWSDTKRGYNR